MSTTPKNYLDLKENDVQFEVLGKLLVEKYSRALERSNGKPSSIIITAADKDQLSRMIRSRDSFVEALRYRLRSCPQDSSKSIHVITRQCRSLGLHREGTQNLLYVDAGQEVLINQKDVS